MKHGVLLVQGEDHTQSRVDGACKSHVSMLFQATGTNALNELDLDFWLLM